MRFEEEGWDLDLHKPPPRQFLWKEIPRDPEAKRLKVLNLWEARGIEGVQVRLGTCLSLTAHIWTGASQWRVEQSSGADMLTIFGLPDRLRGFARLIDRHWKAMGAIEVEGVAYGWRPDHRSGNASIHLADGTPVLRDGCPWRDSHTAAGIVRLTTLAEGADRATHLEFLAALAICIYLASPSIETITHKKESP